MFLLCFLLPVLGWAWFLLCTGFISFFSFFFLSVTSDRDWITQPVTFICQKLLFSLLCTRIKYFSFGLIKVLDSKGILNTLKQGITSAMECIDAAAFTFVTRQIRLCLLYKFISPEAMVNNLFAILQKFLVGLGN